MDYKCPNCRGEAKRTEVTTGQVYIECAQCGLFEVQPDGSHAACDAADVQSACSASGDVTAASPKAGDGVAAVDAAPSEETSESSREPAEIPGAGAPARSPGPAGDEDGEIELTLTDEVEY